MALWLSLELFFFTFVLRPIENFDFWWHLATGRYITQTHHIPLFDVFSFTCHGHKWLNSYWLYEVILYNVYHQGGLWGILLFKGVLATMIFLPLLLRFHKRRLEPTIFLMMALLTFYGSRLSSNGWGEHASQVSLMILSWLYWHLELMSDPHADRRWLMIWPPLFALWANLHPGWPLGLVVIALWSLSDVVNDRSHFKTLLLFGMACVLATFIHPDGWRTYLAIPEGMRHGHWIQEWQPPGWTHMQLYWLFLLGFLYYLVSNRQAWRQITMELFVGTFLAWSSLQHVFTVSHFVVFISPYLAGHAQILIKRVMPLPLTRLLNRWSNTAGALCVGGLVFHNIHLANASVPPSLFPVGACDFIEKEALQLRIFNAYAFGGYWIWRFAERMPVFIDGRYPTVKGYAELYEDIRAAQQSTPGVWKSFLERWQIDGALLDYPATQPGVSVYDHFFPQTEWALVYWDDLSILYLRRLPKHKKVISRTEFKHMRPDLSPEDFRTRLSARRDSTRETFLELLRNQALHPDSQKTETFLRIMKDNTPAGSRRN